MIVDRGSEPAGRRTFTPRLGAFTQLILAAVLAAVSALAGGQQPDFLPRPLVLFGLFALPGIVGLIAIRRERAGLLIAAAAASSAGAFIAFSGVTLIFLVPAALMAIGAMGLANGRVGGWREVLFGLLRSLLVLALLLGAGWSALLITDRACWIVRETPGGIVVEPTAFATGEIRIPTNATAGGCAEGLLSARGVSLALLLGGAAIAIAFLSVDRRRRP